jgi:hypothetical protein
MPRWLGAFLEFFVVIAFAIGWAAVEWQCRRLDHQKAEREAQSAQSGSAKSAIRHP